jgi:hypothetical protein
MLVRPHIAFGAATLLFSAAAAFSHELPSAAQELQAAQAKASEAKAAAESRILFENVRIFDGASSELSAPSNVLVHGNIIEKISREKIPADGARIINGGGRTLMPGLIDAHWHSMFVGVPIGVALTQDATYLNIVAGVEARKTLMRGFTTVRDVGGAVFSLKLAVDQGVIPGPRIYPSGAMISVTSGHGDFRSRADLPRTLGAPGSRHDIVGDSTIADSPDEVRMRTREQLMQGASQIKLTGGGGVSSPHSPLDVVTFTEPELKAAVDAATDWGTYVAVHAYTPTAIQRAIRAGVLCIEHAQHAALSRRDGGCLPKGLRSMGEGAGSLCRHRQDVPACDQAQAEDRVWNGHPVLEPAGRTAGQDPGGPDPVVHPGANPHHGHQHERTAPEAVRPAQSVSR